MGSFKVNFTPISIHLLLFVLMAVTVDSALQDDVCALINCGQGTCKASNASLTGFECECNSGWKKIEIGPLTFPSCVLPNCTIDFGCGNGAQPSPSPSPPPPASLPPPLNLSNPCNLVWCGDGTCVENGTGHICQCTEDSSNLLNKTDLACFKQCSFGADCNGLVLPPLPSLPLPLPPPQPQPPPPPPPPSGSASPKTNGSTGSNETSNSWRHLYASSMILLAATFLTWL